MIKSDFRLYKMAQIGFVAVYPEHSAYKARPFPCGTRRVPVGCPTILKGPGRVFTSLVGAGVLSKLLPIFPAFS